MVKTNGLRLKTNLFLFCFVNRKQRFACVQWCVGKNLIYNLIAFGCMVLLQSARLLLQSPILSVMQPSAVSVTQQVNQTNCTQGKWEPFSFQKLTETCGCFLACLLSLFCTYTAGYSRALASCGQLSLYLTVFSYCLTISFCINDTPIEYLNLFLFRLYSCFLCVPIFALWLYTFSKCSIYQAVYTYSICVKYSFYEWVLNGTAFTCAPFEKNCVEASVPDCDVMCCVVFQLETGSGRQWEHLQTGGKASTLQTSAVE